MKLAHYTHVLSLPGIVRDGITRGDVPVTPMHSLQFPWFTLEFSQAAQEDWVCGMRFKSALRLEVEFRDNDERLVRWRDYAKRLRLRDDWYEQMTGPRVGTNGRTWFVYRGAVPFAWVKEAYFHPCREHVSPASLPKAAEMLGALNIEEEPLVPCRYITEEDALTLSHDEWMAAHSKPVEEALLDIASHQVRRLVPPRLCPPPANTFLAYVEGVVRIHAHASLLDEVFRHPANGLQ